MVDGHCWRVIHAEANCLFQAGDKADGGTLYCTLMPCPSCIKIALQHGIKRIVYAEAYNKQEVAYFMTKLGDPKITFEQVSQ